MWPRMVVNGLATALRCARSAHRGHGGSRCARSPPQSRRPRERHRDSPGTRPRECRTYTLEDTEAAAEFLVERLDLLVLAQDVVDGEATRVVCRARMVGDAKIVIAELKRGFGHLAQCVHPVGIVGVDVQKAFEVFGLHQLGQLPRLRAFNFAGPFAQFRRNERKAEALVDRLFTAAFPTSPRAADAVRTENKLSRLCQAFELGKMRCVTRRIEQCAAQLV